MTRERRQSALPDPPANCGQVVASWTILCRSCSTTRTIMVASGQRAVDRAAAQRAWRRLGWVQDLIYGWECPQCSGSVRRLAILAAPAPAPERPLAAWRPGLTAGGAPAGLVCDCAGLCCMDGCVEAAQVDVWLATAIRGCRAVVSVCRGHAAALSAKVG